MLKNLIASCMIAANVNIQPLTPNKAIETNYTFQYDEGSTSFAEGTINRYNYTRYTLNDNYYISGRAIQINQQGHNSQQEYIVANQNENNLDYIYPLNQQSDPNYGTSSQGYMVPGGQLYYLELEGNNLNKNVTITLDIKAILDITYIDNQPTTPSRYYYEYIYSSEATRTTTAFDTLYNYNQPTIAQLGSIKNIYGIYEETKALYYNTQSTFIKNQTEYTNSNEKTLTIDLFMQPKVKNYYYILIQPQTMDVNIQEYNGYPQQSPSYGMLQAHYITGTGTNMVSDAPTEVIDLPGVMFEVVGMPFTFISTAFNLTIFPGTNYSVNISNLVLTIFAILVFLFLLKIFLKMKG